MKSEKRSVWRAAEYQIRLLFTNARLLWIPVCMFIFVTAWTKELRKFMADYSVKSSPFLLDFVANSPELFVCLMISIIPFLSEAPFFKKEQVFAFLRVGRKKWIQGNLLYIFFFSAFYTLLLYLISVAVLCPYVDISNHWGKVWTTLAVTDVRYKYGIIVSVPDTVIFSYSPWEALAITLLFLFLLIMFYAFFMWILNLLVGRVLSIAITCASMFLITRVAYLPEFFYYLTPMAWAQLLAGTDTRYMMYGIIRLIILTATLLVGVYFLTTKRDFME